MSSLRAKRFRRSRSVAARECANILYHKDGRCIKAYAERSATQRRMQTRVVVMSIIDLRVKGVQGKQSTQIWLVFAGSTAPVFGLLHPASETRDSRVVHSGSIQTPKLETLEIKIVLLPGKLTIVVPRLSIPTQCRPRRGGSHEFASLPSSIFSTPQIRTLSRRFGLGSNSRRQFKSMLNHWQNNFPALPFRTYQPTENTEKQYLRRKIATAPSQALRLGLCSGLGCELPGDLACKWCITVCMYAAAKIRQRSTIDRYRLGIILEETTALQGPLPCHPSFLSFRFAKIQGCWTRVQICYDHQDK
ncbi:hypothetical protein K438DRAFT_1752779 [Mycena galopus ATCC 62051]|nr:hypothetical protein K438DRAFT_1752779 [Mycena galopus ATCC 62051]